MKTDIDKEYEKIFVVCVSDRHITQERYENKPRRGDRFVVEDIRDFFLKLKGTYGWYPRKDFKVTARVGNIKLLNIAKQLKC